MITREGFRNVVDNAFAGMGFAAEAAKHVFPLTMFLPGSDLTPIDSNIETIIQAFTAWKPQKPAKQRIMTPPPVVIEGSDYPDVQEKLNQLFLRNLWSDGLPLLPATKERVDRLLAGTDLPREKVLGKMLPRGGIVTIEGIAVAAVMAGCRPEYLPVLIACVEAVLDPLVHHQQMNSTTGAVHPTVIVNGPVARQIRINSGYGCLGPSSLFPAGATIGRALRLVLLNVGGAIPGVGSMSNYGGPAQFTGPVFAEDEVRMPADWAPFNVERGAAPGTNGITLQATSGAIGTWDGAALNEHEALDTLGEFASLMRVWYGGYFGNAFNPQGTPGIVVIGPTTAQGYANLGWSKNRIKTWLWENSQHPDSPWLRGKLAFWARRTAVVKDYIRYPMPICVAPENIMLVVAGGVQSGKSYWFQTSGGAKGPAMRAIALPAKWNDLLARAEEELGPLPSG